MNSVHMRAIDATGVSYLDTFAANRPDVIAGFRQHAAWWLRYVRTREGQAAYQRTTKGAPCFPVRIEIQPYEDQSQ